MSHDRKIKIDKEIELQIFLLPLKRRVTHVCSPGPANGKCHTYSSSLTLEVVGPSKFMVAASGGSPQEERFL